MSNEVGHSPKRALREASTFLRRWVVGRDVLTAVLFGLLAFLVSLYVLWLEGQPLSMRMLGYAGFFVIVMVLASAVPGFMDLHTRWLISRYDARFDGFPPLLVTLMTFMPRKLLDPRRLLTHRRDLLLEAFRREGMSLDDQARVLISRGDASAFGGIVSKDEFYGQLNEYIRTDPGRMEWCTGEFGMLRDDTFLTNLKSCEQSRATITGYVQELTNNLDLALQRLSNRDEEERKPSSYAIERDEHPQIKSLVKAGKLSLFGTPTPLKVPHCATLGGYVYIQQRHVHVRMGKAPVVTILVKKPSAGLLHFVETLLREVKAGPGVTAIE